MKNKKASSIIIATILLLVVVIIGVSVFNNWFNFYSSSLFSKIENKNELNLINIEDVIGNKIYIKNLENNLTLNKIKIGNKTCRVSKSNKNLSNGISNINLWDCLSNLKTSTYDFVLYTDKKVISKSIYYDKNKADTFKGIISWSKIYSTTNGGFGNALDFDSFGNLYVVGRIYTTDNNPIILKYSIDGKLLSNITDFSGGFDRFQDIKLDANNNIYVVGDFYNTTSSIDYFRIRKYSNSGIILWDRLFEYSASVWDYQVGGIDLDNLGNVYVTGSIYNTSSTDDELLVVKLNYSGDQIWNRTFGGFQNEGFGIKVVNNEIYVSGNYDYWTLDDPLILKYNSSGDLLLNKSFSDSGYDRAYDVDVDSFGNIYYVGDFYNGSLNMFILRKLDNLGNIIWDKKYFGGGFSDTAYEIYIDDIDNIYVTGSLNNGTSDNPFVAKFDISGKQLWNSSYLTTQNDWTEGVISDENGNIYITGRINNQFGIIKYQ